MKKSAQSKPERRGGARPGSGRKKNRHNKATEDAKAEAAASGELPLAYMLRVMRDPKANRDRRDGMAKAAAPYLHAKLSSVEVAGKENGEPIRFLMVNRDAKEKG